MRRSAIFGLRRVAIAVALLPLLASCWWLDSTPGPGECGHRSGTIGDFRPHHVATLYEAEGFNQLQLECSQGPITFSVGLLRDDMLADTIRLPVRYRLDGRPPVAVEAWSNGSYVWLRDPQTATGEDPLVQQIAGARQLVMRFDWPSGPQTMRFDTSRSAAAIERLRDKCADAHARRS